MKHALMGAALLALCSTANAADWDVKAMNETIDQTNFLVNRGCSGTLLDAEQGLILTANHCVADQYETLEREVVDDKGIVTRERYRHTIPGTVSQFDFNGAEKVKASTYKMTVKAVDIRHDLALVQVVAKLPNTKASQVSCAAPVRGDKAYVVGNPMGILYSSVTVGIVSSIQRDYSTLSLEEENDGGLMQISSGVIGGNSGGSVYNSDGEIIGVVVRGSRMNEILGFAVPVDVVKNFLQEKGFIGLVARCYPAPK